MKRRACKSFCLMRCGYICVWKSPPSIGLFLGRDEVERVFEVSSGGHRGRDIPQCTCMDSIFTFIIMGEHFSLAVLCVLIHGFCT